MGKKVKWTIMDLVSLCKSWMANKYDGIIVIDGNRGLGKSTTGVKLGFKMKFKPQRDICFSRDDVTHEISTQQNGFILADEMINVTYNREFFNQEQLKLIKILNMYRDSKNILVCCVPNFYDLDKQFRKLVKLRIHCIRRGLAVMHMPVQSAYMTDKWDSANNEKIEKGWIKRGVFRPRYDRLSTFRGFLVVYDLSPKRREIYERIKQEKRNVLYDNEPQQDSKTAFYDKLLSKIKEGKIPKETLMQIADLNNIRYKTLCQALNDRLKDGGENLTISQVYHGIPRYTSKSESNSSFKSQDFGEKPQI